MANVAFSGLAQLSSLQRADLICATDDSESSSEKSKYVTIGTLQDFLMITGRCVRSQFVYKDADEIYVGAGNYDVAGKLAAWTSQLTKSFSGLSASTWYYIYLDYSAITSGTAITASEIIYSTTAPSYSHTYRGWYNGSDRCIFAVLTDSSGDILEFFHDDNLISFADQITSRTLADLDTTWTDVTLDIPGFSTAGEIIFELYNNSSASAAILYYRTNGQSGTTGHIVGRTEASNTGVHINTIMAHTDSSQVIEIKMSKSANHQAGVYTSGYYLPIGM